MVLAFMEELSKNIINLFGDSGQIWLDNLDKTIKELQKHWHLEEIDPVSNMSYNFVARALTKKNQPVILKISCDRNVIEEEVLALKYFNGHGSIILLDHNQKYNAVLLQQAIPGTTLKQLYPQQLEFVMDRYISTMKKIHNHPLPKNNGFRSISFWLESIDKASPKEIPESLLIKAVTLKNQLLNSMQSHIVLHGDLHLDNILCNDNEWLCIDPKGIIGEPEFEIAAFDFIAENEIATATSQLISNRINQIADKSQLSAQRIKNWTFVRLILSAAWSIEDKSDPSIAIHLANLLAFPDR